MIKEEFKDGYVFLHKIRKKIKLNLIPEQYIQQLKVDYPHIFKKEEEDVILISDTEQGDLHNTTGDN